MSAPTKQYNGKKMFLVYGGVPAVHMEEVSISFTSPTAAPTVLVDGTEVINVSNDNSADIEVTLAQASGTNDIFSADVSAMKTLGTVVFKTVLFKDINGTSLMSGAQAYLVGFPDVAFAKESGTRVWKIHCSDLKVLIGGHV